MADVIKEFLVQLGYKVDEASLAKFTKSVENTTKEVVGLGAEMVATALAIQVGISRMARDFEQLYFVSSRTHSSVTALQSFEYAAKTIGVTSDQARSAVEGLADAMRSNPGVGALLNRFGVQTAGRGSVEILDDFVEKLGKMPFYIAQQYAAIAGIDGKTLYQLLQRHAELKRAEEDRKKRVQAAGVDEQKLAKDSHDYNNELRHLEDNLGILGEQITAKFLPALKWGVHLVDQLTDGFIHVNRATEGWAGVIGTVATSALGVYIGKLLLMKTLFRGVAAEAAAATTATASAAGGAGIGTWLLRLLGPVGALLGMTSEAGNAGSEAPKLAGGVVNPNKVIDFFRGKGWSTQAAAGIAANLDKESNFRPNARGDGGQAYGVAQWHPDRQAAFAQWAGHDIRSSTLEEQLGFVNHELTKGAEQFAGRMLARATSAQEAGAIVSKFYERPANASGEAASRGGQAQHWYNTYLGTQGGSSGATINQKTDIHVHGADARDAADKTVSAQDRVNGDIVRNVGAVTR